MGSPKRLRKFKLLITFVWLLLVLYPNPYRLYLSIYRSVHHPIDVVAIVPLIDQLPGDTPHAIEFFVMNAVSYQYDWTTYNIPWYFPTVQEVLINGAGDCKSRMIVLASLFESLHIPYEIRYSLNHYWVHYEGRNENHLERNDLAFFVQDGDRGYFKVPHVDLSLLHRSLIGFFDAMPRERSLLFILGTFMPALILHLWVRRRVGRSRKPSADGEQSLVVAG